MATLQSLYSHRCYDRDGHLVPHFWKPQPLKATPHTLWGNDDHLVDGGHTMQKCIALGLLLELPVGEFVSQATKQELPNNPVLLKLLKSNIADEAAHFKGFQYAADAYPVPQEYLDDAQHFTARFQALPNHPIEIACGLETGLFLITLGLMRLIGGASLSTMAAQISQDEYRHAATNRALVKAMRFDVVPSFAPLLNEVITWLADKLNVPSADVGIKVDADYLLSVSHELLSTGVSRGFNDLVFYANHNLPFEIANDQLYSRSVL